MKLPEAWRSRLAQISDKRFYLYLLIVAAFLVSVVTIVVALQINRNFLTVACDTAAFQNAMVNTLDGRWFRDTAYDGPNLLGLHATFILVPLAFIYALSPATDTLFALQILGVWSTIFPLYLIGVKQLRHPATAFLVAMLALISPMLIEMAWAPYHPETWILAGAFWSYYFYLCNRPVGFGISLVLTLCCGEQAGLIFVTLGAAWLLVEDGHAWRKRYGAYTLGVSLAWIALTVGLIIPMMHHPGQLNLVAYNYSEFQANSFPELAERIAQNPLTSALFMFRPGVLIRISFLIGVPLFLALTSRRTLLLLTPVFLYFLMSDQEIFLYFHAYYFQFAFLAGYLALIGFLARHEITERVTILVLAATLLVNAVALTASAGFYVGLGLVGGPNTRAEILHHVFSTIPLDAGVYTPHRFSAYLSNHENMVMGDISEPNLNFDEMLASRFSTTDVRPDQISYIVCDLVNDQCGRREAGYKPDVYNQRSANLDNLVKTGAWEPYWNQDNVIILRRKTP